MVAANCSKQASISTLWSDQGTPHITQFLDWDLFWRKNLAVRPNAVQSICEYLHCPHLVVIIPESHIYSRHGQIELTPALVGPCNMKFYYLCDMWIFIKNISAFIFPITQNILASPERLMSGLFIMRHFLIVLILLQRYIYSVVK